MPPNLQGPHDTGRIRANIDIAAIIGAKTYLEIGCQSDFTFNAMPVETKVGIDPKSGGNIRMTSDTFFGFLRAGHASIHTVPVPKLFDLIFIDGDHHHEQVAKDIRNALDFLAPNGVITCHDVYPPDARHESPTLCGTAWRAFVREARTRADVDAYVSDVDQYGLGIMRKTTNTWLISMSDLPAGYDKMSYGQINNEGWTRYLEHDQALRRLGLTT